MLERQVNLNLVFHIDKEIEIPSNLEERDGYCEHCNSKRARKYLFILLEEETGMQEMEEEFFRGYDGDVYYNNIDVIAISAYFTDKEGYIATSNGTKENPSILYFKRRVIMRINQVFAYFNERDLMFRSMREILEDGIQLATLEEVIDYYIQTGNTLENEDEFVITTDGSFYFEDGDYRKLQ